MKFSKAPIKAVSDAMNVAGDSIGSVMYRHLPKPDAPSMAAASYISVGIV